MLTRRQYVSIFLLFLALFILFQGPQLARYAWNDYNVNENAAQKSGLRSGSQWSSSNDTNETERRSVFYVGDTGSEAYAVCSSWALYTKRRLYSYHASQVSEENLILQTAMVSPDIVCIDSYAIEENGYNWITDILRKGINVVFVSLPDARTVAADDSLMSLLGIYYIRSMDEQALGVHLYKGLFLGGERIYHSEDSAEEEKRQDLDLDVPWYILTAGTRVFMSAISQGEEGERLENKDMPALIWRTKKENAFVYVVNGSYMDDKRIGMGILSGIVSDASDYEIYPVVNAQNLVLLNFPELADENQDTMQEVYGYSQTMFEKNIIVSGIWSMLRDVDFKPTATVLPQYDYSSGSDPVSGELQYYLRQLREVHGEAGISYEYTGTDDLNEVLSQTDSFLYDESDGYEYAAAWVPDESDDKISEILENSRGGNLTTVLTPYQNSRDVFSYMTDDCTQQSALSDAAVHTYTDDLELLGDESALGFSTITLDIKDTLWPDDSSDRWENMSDEAFSNIASYWSDFSMFDRTTLSESDRKIRQFLALDYTAERSGDTIHIHTDGLEEEASYLLRMHDMEVTDMSGGTYAEIEDGVFLITAASEDAYVTITNDDSYSEQTEIES